MFVPGGHNAYPYVYKLSLWDLPVRLAINLYRYSHLVCRVKWKVWAYSVFTLSDTNTDFTFTDTGTDYVTMGLKPNCICVGVGMNTSTQVCTTHFLSVSGSVSVSAIVNTLLGSNHIERQRWRLHIDLYLDNPHQASASYPFSSIDSSANIDAYVDTDARCGHGFTS